MREAKDAKANDRASARSRGRGAPNVPRFGTRRPEKEGAIPLGGSAEALRSRPRMGNIA